MGKTSLESKTIADEEAATGDNTFYSAGLGAKYVLNNGFGIRAILDYYSSNETYTFDDSTDSRTLSGPRVQFGLSYRF